MNGHDQQKEKEMKMKKDKERKKRWSPRNSARDSQFNQREPEEMAIEEHVIQQQQVKDEIRGKGNEKRDREPLAHSPAVHDMNVFNAKGALTPYSYPQQKDRFLSMPNGRIDVANNRSRELDIAIPPLRNFRDMALARQRQVSPGAFHSGRDLGPTFDDDESYLDGGDNTEFHGTTRPIHPSSLNLPSMEPIAAVIVGETPSIGTHFPATSNPDGHVYDAEKIVVSRDEFLRLKRRYQMCFFGALLVGLSIIVGIALGPLLSNQSRDIATVPVTPTTLLNDNNNHIPPIDGLSPTTAPLRFTMSPTRFFSQRICNWPNLSGCASSIVLDGARLTGTIPTQIGDWTFFRSISVSRNTLSGTIPSELGLLTGLTILHLSQDGLTGSVPKELRFLTLLKILNFYRNALTGIVPSELGLLTLLTRLDLGENQLMGQIPTQLGRLSMLRQLRLTTNFLSGPLPSEFGRLSRLQEFNMFRVPSSSIGPSLNKTAASKKQLNGTIPTEWGGLRSLSSIRIPFHNLTGQFPTELGRLTRLIRLIFRFNQLSGPLPLDALSKLSKLQVLKLENNKFNESLSSSLSTWGNLTRLELLDLTDNEMSGSIPWPAISTLPRITDLVLRQNQFRGSLSTHVGLLKTLKVLDIRHNRLTGPLPTEIGYLTRLTFLDIRGNRFTGILPSELGLLTRLRSLILQANQFRGSIPHQLQNLAGKLTTLRLARNDQLNASTLPPDLLDLNPFDE